MPLGTEVALKKGPETSVIEMLSNYTNKSTALILKDPAAGAQRE